MKYVSIAALVLLSSCGVGSFNTDNPSSIGPTQQVSAANRVFAIKTSYQIPLVAAVNYNKLPPCERVGAPVICRNAEVVAVLRQANDAAIKTLDAAEYIVRSKAVPEATKQLSVDSAEKAVKAMEAVVASTKK